MTPITDKGILLIVTYVNNNIKSSLYILAPESLHVCGCHGIPLHSIRAARQIGADAVIGVVCIVLVQTCTKLLTRGRFQRSIGSPSFWFAEINTNVILLTLYTVIYINGYNYMLVYNKVFMKTLNVHICTCYPC